MPPFPVVPLRFLRRGTRREPSFLVLVLVRCPSCFALILAPALRDAFDCTAGCGEVMAVDRGPQCVPD
jgi:hypothetical protein